MDEEKFHYVIAIEGHAHKGKDAYFFDDYDATLVQRTGTYSQMRRDEAFFRKPKYRLEEHKSARDKRQDIEELLKEHESRFFFIREEPVTQESYYADGTLRAEVYAGLRLSALNAATNHSFHASQGKTVPYDAKQEEQAPKQPVIIVLSPELRQVHSSYR